MNFLIIFFTALFIGFCGMLQQGLVELYPEYNSYLVAFAFWFIAGLIALGVYSGWLFLKKVIPHGPDDQW